jgi:hypothetical protein
LAESSARALPPVTFSSFIISLAHTALVHLGEVLEPGASESAVDLSLAQHTIDAIGVLEAKTLGNLDADEAKLLSSVLDELRLKFVEVSQRKR